MPGFLDRLRRKRPREVPPAPLAPAPPPPPVVRVPNKEERHVAWNALETSLRLLEKSADAFGPLKSVVGGLVACINTVETAAKNRKDYELLASELKTMVDAITPYATRLGQSGIVAHIFESIEVEVSQISQQQQHGKTRRFFEASQDAGDVIQRYQKIETLFRQLQTDISLRTLDDSDWLVQEASLLKLSPVHEAPFDSGSTAVKRHGCTPNTRKNIQDDLRSWALKSDDATVNWMNGMAGTGKTTISYSLCQWLENKRILGGNFFCSRLSNSCNKAETIVPTLAYQLARYSPAFRAALCSFLRYNPDAATKGIRSQFQKLVQEPMLRVKDAMGEGVVFVIDALDECMDTSSVGLFLDTVLQLGKDLPIKFFLTSRPEPIIISRMRKSKYWDSTLHLHDIEEAIVAADIKAYLAEALGCMSPELSSTDLQELTDRSGKLFIYAATVVRYVLSNLSASAHRLQKLLQSPRSGSSSSKQYTYLNELYMGILRAALQNDDLDEEEKETMRLALWTCICAKENITTQTLASLHNLSEKYVTSFLEPLRSILHVQEESGLISALHASFPDFMFDQSRSAEFHCDIAVHSEFLANACFDVMERQLKFNICDLESSALFDDQVPDLKERVEKSISHALSYSCRYWAEHLQEGSNTAAAHSKLVDFLTLRLLFWMEVLNLLKAIAQGSDILKRAEQWPTEDQKETRTLLDDAMIFVTRYARGACNRSTPHIYMSRLPFCRKTSSIYANYTKRTRGLVNVRGTAMEDRRDHPPVICMAKSVVKSVAFSPDGNRIVSGLDDQTIRVWDSRTGASVAEPFAGHADHVNSVAFSLDGTRIVSGSDDKTIRVWDARTGKSIAGPIIGHEDWVMSVAFSPDGTCIASSSRDKTVRVWDAQSGESVAGPFIGHEDLIRSVAFSSDGTRIVSGSDDQTIRVWDALTGDSVAGPIIGHEDYVWFVAFSPDGSRVASSSLDKTIRVWDALTGDSVAGPFIGHEDYVWSVAFSPDGTRIVSGSMDKTIRVWDALTRDSVAGLFTGHEGSVLSVAFSPDGTRIVSGSSDKTIRVWDALTGNSVVGPFIGHDGTVWSVAFSSDGTRIVSGSHDKTIRVWDALTGDSVAGSFIGHEDYVCSVAFSLDGTRIVSGSDDKTIRVWDARTGDSIAGPIIGHEDWVMSAAFSPDGTCIASGSRDKTVRVWDAQSGESVAGPFIGHDDLIRSVAFSPDGTRIVSGSDDKTIRVWDALTGDSVAGPIIGHEDYVWSVAFSPDGTRILSGSMDKTIRVWDALTGDAVAGLFIGHEDSVLSVAFSPDGTRIVSGSSDKTIRVWDALTGDSVAGPFIGHEGNVWSVAFSPNGTRIVSGSDDKTIRVWDALTGESVAGPFIGLVRSVTFSFDGTHTVSGSNDMPSPVLSVPISEGAAGDKLPVYTSASDGWTFCDGIPFLWVSPDLISHFSFPHNPLTIGPRGVSRIDYRNIALGKTWSSCHRSDSVL